MKLVKRSAEFVGYVVCGNDKIKEWRCPKCRMSVSEDYVCCPYCGQHIKFPTLREDELDNLLGNESNTVNTEKDDGVSWAKVRIIIAVAGGGKTYKIQNEIVRDVTSREIYVIEREEYFEYSNVFNEKYVHVLKPSSDIAFLEQKKNCDIYIDCENYIDEFLQKIVNIVKKARKNNNNVTITFLRFQDNLYEREIFSNANEILIGKCGETSERRIERIFEKELSPLRCKFDFRRIDFK